MSEILTPADILNLSEEDAASFLEECSADPSEFVSAYQQLKSTMPPQCRNCSLLFSFAIDVASGEATFEQAAEGRSRVLSPTECGGAQLRVMEYYDENGALDGEIGYTCLSRVIN